MRSLKDTIEYLTDRVNELKLENKQLADELQEAMETIMDLTDELEEYRMLPKPTKPAPPMPSVKPYNGPEDKLDMTKYLPLVSSNGVYDVNSLVKQFNSSEGVTQLFGFFDEDIKENYTKDIATYTDSEGITHKIRFSGIGGKCEQSNTGKVD